MAFSIEKIAVTAKSRALKAEYSIELAQDLKAIHGLDAETELANILSAEILTEINREVVRTVFRSAKPGAQQNVATQGTFDMDVDSNGRWSVEKFKGLLFQIEREMNAIAKETRRGKGNMLVCSSDVASALSMAGVLDYNPALNTGLNVDDTGSTFVGTLNGRIRVYIDPYSALPSEGNNAAQFFIAGYKGTSLMMLVCSIAHMYLCRWYAQSDLTPSSPRSDLRPATAWFLIHSLRVLLLLPTPILPMLVTSTPTSTTDVSVLPTSCDPIHTGYTDLPCGGLFYVHFFT